MSQFSIYEPMIIGRTVRAAPENVLYTIFMRRDFTGFPFYGVDFFPLQASVLGTKGSSILKSMVDG